MRAVRVILLAFVASLTLHLSAKENPKVAESNISADFHTTQAQMLSLVRSAPSVSDAFVEIDRLSLGDKVDWLSVIKKVSPSTFAVGRDLAMAATALSSGTSEPLPFGEVVTTQDSSFKKLLMLSGSTDSEKSTNFVLSAKLLADFLEQSGSCFREDADPLIQYAIQFTEDCRWVAATCSKSKLGNRAGRVYAERLGADLTIDSFTPEFIDIDKYFENSTLKSARAVFEMPQIFPKYLLATCRLAASRGYVFEPEGFFSVPKGLPYWLPYRPTEIKEYPKMCTPHPTMKKAARMKVLGEARWPIEKMAVEYTEGVKECQTILNDLCSNVRFVKSVPVYSYVTTECKLREVTSGDIDRDAKNMKAKGDTEATILNHLLIKDIIKGCSKLKKQKYDWVDISPSTESCKR